MSIWPYVSSDSEGYWGSGYWQHSSIGFCNWRVGTSTWGDCFSWVFLDFLDEMVISLNFTYILKSSKEVATYSVVFQHVRCLCCRRWVIVALMYIMVSESGLYWELEHPSWNDVSSEQGSDSCSNCGQCVRICGGTSDTRRIPSTCSSW